MGTPETVGLLLTVSGNGVNNEVNRGVRDSVIPW